MSEKLPIDFPLTITMSQLLSYEETIAELERLRAQLAAVPLEELRRQYDVAPMGVHDFGLDAIKVEKWLRSLETQRWLRNREPQP